MCRLLAPLLDHRANALFFGQANPHLARRLNSILEPAQGPRLAPKL
jgi:hypothetical protein